MLVMIDNYDSFTYNLVQYFQILKHEVLIFQNDKISLDELENLSPSYIVISPGPNCPEDSGISLDLIKKFYQHTPILGICLGHQCLAAAFGAKILPAPEIMHGKTSAILHHKQKLFSKLPSPFTATRYHSLVVDVATLPDTFAIDAWADETIMAISHRFYPLFGVQFHPESILSEYGLQLLANFLNAKPKVNI